MERIPIISTLKKTGQKVRLCGWVERRRDHGQLVFIDLKDRSGLIQVVGQKKLGDLRISDVIEVVGQIRKRPPQLINPKIPTGKIEVEGEKVTILARSKDLPLDIHADGYQIGEETRCQYRYLDLRRPRLVRNMELRYQTIKFIRDWLDKRGFIEIETPILTKATPEGARDFLVPSRLHPGEFYALPQSPQQYKQLLMVAGFEKYYQIARCFRDEDPRADRAYGEFTQLDLEMSFVTQEEILVLVENLFKEISEKVLKKKVWKFPFPRLKYAEVMRKYGTDKPDLRPDKKDPDLLAFAFVVDFPLFEWGETRKRWEPMHHPFTAPKKEEISFLDKNPGKVHSYQHDLVLNGGEVGGGSIRITDPKLQEKIFKILGHSEKEIEKKFGHLFEAFEYGVPPHGGIAPGIDRFLMYALGEPSLREVMAFPATSGGQTAVMNAPSEVDPVQLKELGIQTVKVRKKKSTLNLFEKIIQLLDKNQIGHQLYEHKPVYTSEEAAKVRETKIEQGAKALVMLADKKPVLLVLSAAKKIDNKKFKKAFEVKDLRMATAKEVEKITGVKIGAVPPFGNLIGLKTFVDEGLSENKEIVFSAGLHTRSIKIKCQDWTKLVKPKKADFAA